MKYEQLQKQSAAKWAQFDSPDVARVLIGMGTCGRAAGGDDAMDLIAPVLSRLGVDAVVSETGCLGLCYVEPLVELQRPGGPRILYGHVTSENIEQLLEDVFGAGDLRTDLAVAVMAGEAEGIPAFTDLPMIKPQVRVVLRNCGVIDPADLDHYIARGGYGGLAKALAMSGEDVIGQVKASGLRGRGGAGFPTARKWELARASESDQKYVICNADEGDPGAFMDRSAIEGDPHSVLEGLAIAAYAIGASAGYIYVRAEYPLAIERLETAIAQANERGLLGEDIFESGFSFSVRIKKGAGAFVCGEETAMMASLEGGRGMPRTRPPFPAQKGLYGKPTNINNVETLANVPVILSEGGAAFAKNGTEKSPGTKTFALAGKIVRTGLIEVPLGISLREIVYDVGGGIPDDKEFKAVQTGGPSGGCIPADLLDLSVDYEHLTQAGAIMGSGGMVVMDDETCMVDVARYFVDFTQKESCGKCVPCRLGTRQMLEILQDITKGEGAESDLDLLGEIAESVKLGSLCGLGQTAPNPVLTTLKYFANEYAAHVTDSKCPAGVCRALTTFVIDTEACKACGRCVKACPTDAISSGVKKVPAVIDQDKCITCGVCRETCPFDAVATA